MKITYDPGADVLHVALASRAGASAEVFPGVYLARDTRGRVTALELLNASQHVPRAELERLPSAVEYLTPQELAHEHGLTAGSIANLAAASKFAGATKRGGTWLIPAAAFDNYLEERHAAGRPPKSTKARRARKRQRARTSRA